MYIKTSLKNPSYALEIIKQKFLSLYCKSYEFPILNIKIIFKFAYIFTLIDFFKQAERFSTMISKKYELRLILV